MTVTETDWDVVLLSRWQLGKLKIRRNECARKRRKHKLQPEASVHLSFTCNPVHLAHPGQNMHVEAAGPETHRQHRQLSCCLLHKMHPSETWQKNIPKTSEVNKNNSPFSTSLSVKLLTTFIFHILWMIQSILYLQFHYLPVEQISIMKIPSIPSFTQPPWSWASWPR